MAVAIVRSAIDIVLMVESFRRAHDALFRRWISGREHGVLALRLVLGRRDPLSQFFDLLIEERQLLVKVGAINNVAVVCAVQKYPHGIAGEIRYAPCSSYRAQALES